MYLIFQRSLFLILLRLVFSQKSESWDPHCTDKWPNCGEIVNTACEYPSCDPRVEKCMELPPDAEFRQMVLDTHNELREQIASGRENRSGIVAAANMNALSYDLNLEFTAICHVNGCLMVHDECRRVKGYYYVGQNLSKRKVINTVPLTQEDYDEIMNLEGFRSLIVHWYAEIEKDDYSDLIDNLTRFREVTGHFTGMISSGTTHVGCATALHRPNDTEFTMHLTCHYGPSGNIKYAPIYKRGPPCSKCPNGTSCNDKYHSLCGKIDESDINTGPNPYRELDSRRGRSDSSRADDKVESKSRGKMSYNSKNNIFAIVTFFSIFFLN